MIQIGSATITYYGEGAFTTYPDGKSYAAQPHHGDHRYTLIAARCGYSPDFDGRLRYAREHEACHSMVAEWIGSSPSKVLWPLAHGDEPDRLDAIQEESLVMTFQRWLRANEEPIIGSVDWADLKRRALALLDEAR